MRANQREDDDGDTKGGLCSPGKEHYDLVADQRRVCLRGFALLVLERVAVQEAIQRLLPAIEEIDVVIPSQRSVIIF
jgi:hypothetical protein